jgi:hypothetical protein
MSENTVKLTTKGNGQIEGGVIARARSERAHDHGRRDGGDHRGREVGVDDGPPMRLGTKGRSQLRDHRCGGRGRRPEECGGEDEDDE